MKKSILLFALSSAFVSGLGQSGIQWQKCLGSSGNDGSFSCRQTLDGGYIVGGNTDTSNTGDVTGNHGNGDCWITKLDSNGVIQWKKCFGGSSEDDMGKIKPTIDNGYIFVGGTFSSDGDVTSNHGSADCWIVKLNSSGNILWQKGIGGSSYDYAADVQQTTDGGFIIAGQTSSADGDVSANHGNGDYWVVKLDSLGAIQWEKSYGGSLTETISEIKCTTDGGYIVCGATESNDGDVSGLNNTQGFNDYWVLKLDVNGGLQWQKCLGGVNFEWAHSICQVLDGSYVVVGYTGGTDVDPIHNHGGGDVWAVKLNTNGNVIWNRCYGGSGEEIAFGVESTNDSGIMIAGWTWSNNNDVIGYKGGYSLSYWGGGDCWIIKVDSLGSIVWQNCYGGSEADAAMSIQQTTDAGYVFSGYTWSNDGDVNGNHDTNGATIDYWVVKLFPENVARVTEIESSFNYSVYPNPSQGLFTLETNSVSPLPVKIYDVLGNLVFAKDLYGTSEIDISELSDGFYSVTSGEKSNSHQIKIIKVRGH